MINLKRSTLRSSLQKTSFVLFLGSAALLLFYAATRIQPRGIDFGRVSISSFAGNLEVSLANASITRSDAGWTFTNVGARIVVESASVWVPTSQSAAVTLTVPGAAPLPLSLRVIFLPTWLAGLVLVAGTILSFHWSRRIDNSNHCNSCDYDLQGISSGKCPECGDNFRILVSVLLCAACLTATGCQAPPPEGDGQKLFVEAIQILESKPIVHERVDWESVRNQLQATIPADGKTEHSHAAIRVAIAKLNDNHARFTPPPSPAPTPAAPAPQVTAVVSAPVTTNRIIPTAPAGVMLASSIAFITVPGCNIGETEGLRDYAAALRAVVLSLNEHRPAAWIIDLRFNGGGNIWPMLVGLQPLLGDGVVTTSIDSAGHIARVICDGNAVWLNQGSGPIEQLRIDVAKFPQISAKRVAILTGPWTMSSGELLALAFHGQARYFGTPTAGITTVTDYFPLSDGSILNLPISHMADRNGWAPRGAIRPDVLIEAADWPTADDAQVKGATQWILEAKAR